MLKCRYKDMRIKKAQLYKERDKLCTAEESCIGNYAYMSYLLGRADRTEDENDKMLHMVASTIVWGRNLIFKV